MNITEIISLLDELKERIENWRFENSEDARTYIQYKFPQLQDIRQAALDGERYRKAGKELINRLEEHLSDTDYPVRHAISAYRQAVKQKEV